MELPPQPSTSPTIKKSKKLEKAIHISRSQSMTAVKKEGKKTALQSNSVTFGDGDGLRTDSIDGEKPHVMKNYFGLPIYATQQTALAIVYQSRGAIVASVETKFVDDDKETTGIDLELTVGLSDKLATSSANQMAQRKVAHSLLSMANTESMTNYFLHKGGIEAVTRLIHETRDPDVLYICASALYQTSMKPESCMVLIEKNILSPLARLIEVGDDNVRLNCVKMLCNLSLLSGVHEERLVMANILSVIQSILAVSNKYEVICHVILCLANVAPGFIGQNDVEVAVRIFIHISKKLDIAHNLPAAIFMMRVFANVSCVSAFTTVLCEESITPLLLHLIDSHPHPEIISYCSESFLNLSLVRKNRREIGSSGIANYLGRMFQLGDPVARARALTTIGNLLVGSYFFEKIAREDLLSTILVTLFDPTQPKQFTAVAYCLSQLAINESCAAILVRCGVVKMTIEYLSDAPMEATSYMWNVLVSLSQQSNFFDSIVQEREALFPTLYQEAQKYEDQAVEAVALLAYNLALRPGLEKYLSSGQIEMLVKTLKLVISKYPPMKLTMLTALVFVAHNISQSRMFIMADDLIKLLHTGDSSPSMNIKCAALLNLISCEENCCMPLIESGAQQFLVTIHASMMTAYSAANKETRGRLERARSVISEKETVATGEDAVSDAEVEIGQGLIAATLHNLSLKRPTLGAGVLALLLNLMKNTKTLRVLHCVRTLANISTQSKAKHILAKERKLIPILTAIMRFGCEEADRVQHYCAIVVCNVLATKFDKSTMEEIIANGTIRDLVVVTLLRVNSISTKESLGRALFNLMSPSDTREKMVTSDLDVLSAAIDLARIESLDLLEISVRSVFNMSCQLPKPESDKMARKFSALKIPALMIARATSSSAVPGCKSTTAIKFLCGMALANMSFVPELGSDLTEEKVSNAAFSIMSLDSDEATYCVSVLLFNLSQASNCVSMADAQAVSLLTSIVPRGPNLCTQLAMAALCNFSVHEAFYHQLTSVALQPVIAVLGSVQYDTTVRMDARRFLYNLTTKYAACRAPAVTSEAISALMNLVKSQTDDAVLISIGRIVKELCSEATDEVIHKKLLIDGVMPLLLKLSKLEIPELKLDLSIALFYMTMVPDSMKVLKWDSVDIMFWLTLHDCLGMQDNILRNVGRALRNFTSVGAEAKFLVKEDRFLAVLRVLSKSQHEDVLWQTAGVCYNILHVEECRKGFLARGAMTLIFELASSGFTSVRHVCSACIHMVPESMPDMEDPLVLQLILCLLDVDGEKQSELGERSYAALPYTVPILIEKSPCTHLETNFKPTWITMTCSVDSLYTPAKTYTPTASTMSFHIKPFDTAAICNSHGHLKLDGADFNHFLAPEVEAPVEEEEEEDEDSDRERGDSIDSSKSPNQKPDRKSSRRQSHSSKSSGRSKTKLDDIKKPQSGHNTGRLTSRVESSQITLPKLIDPKRIPDDTVSAIRSSGGSARKASKSPPKARNSGTLFTTPKIA